MPVAVKICLVIFLLTVTSLAVYRVTAVFCLFIHRRKKAVLHYIFIHNTLVQCDELRKAKADIFRNRKTRAKLCLIIKSIHWNFQLSSWSLSKDEKRRRPWPLLGVLVLYWSLGVIFTFLLFSLFIACCYSSNSSCTEL